MTYYQFVQAVEDRIKEVVKGGVSVRIHTAEKNNGTVRKGITLTEQDINISPTIYLEGIRIKKGKSERNKKRFPIPYTLRKHFFCNLIALFSAELLKIIQ